jgi:hypothetical protein
VVGDVQPHANDGKYGPAKVLAAGAQVEIESKLKTRLSNLISSAENGAFNTSFNGFQVAPSYLAAERFPLVILDGRRPPVHLHAPLGSLNRGGVLIR